MSARRKIIQLAVAALLVASCAPQEAQGPAMGAMLPGTLYTQDGTIMSFAIQKAPRSGGMTAFDPAKEERFAGSYVGTLETINENSSAYVTNGNRSAVGFGSGSVGSNIAQATGFMRGDKGRMLTCSMRIEAGVSPHGVGGCTDNRGRSYRLQF